MNRRSFLIAMGGGLILPYEPQTIYSFPSPHYIRAANITDLMISSHLIKEYQREMQIEECMKWASEAQISVTKVIRNFKMSKL